MLLKPTIENTYNFHKPVCQCCWFSLYTDYVSLWKQGGDHARSCKNALHYLKVQQTLEILNFVNILIQSCMSYKDCVIVHTYSYVGIQMVDDRWQTSTCDRNMNDNKLWMFY